MGALHSHTASFLGRPLYTGQILLLSLFVGSFLCLLSQDQVLLLCPSVTACISPNMVYIILYGHFQFSCLPYAVLYIGGRSFDIFYRGFILFVCGDVRGVNVNHVCHCLQRPEGFQSSRTGVGGGCELTCGCWELAQVLCKSNKSS